MEPEVRNSTESNFEKHLVKRSDGEVTVDGLYPEKTKGQYMVRLRIPGGRITLAEARAIAEIAEQYADGEWHVDTRQNIELHGVAHDNVVPLVEAVEARTSLTTRGSCGDTVRNVVVGGEPRRVDASGRVIDLQRVADAITQRFTGVRKFETLPRKFKIGVFGAHDEEPLHRLNDIGFVEERSMGVSPVPPNRQTDEPTGSRSPSRTNAHSQATSSTTSTNGGHGQDARATGTIFTVYIGGGLGREPRLADLAFAHIPESAAVDFVEAVVGVFHDHGNRKRRTAARFKFVLDEHGLDQVRAWILERWSPPAGVDIAPTAGAVPHRETLLPRTGVHVQSDGRARVIVPLIAGDVEVGIARAIIDAAERAGADGFIFGARQNIAIPDIVPENVAHLVADLARLGYAPSGHGGPTDIVACPGAAQCRKAYLETREFAHVVARALREADVPEWATRIRIGMSGCPNSCTMPQINDLGFRGNVGVLDGKGKRQGFEFSLGGRVRGETRLGTVVAQFIDPDEVTAVVRESARLYATLGYESEPFGDLLNRIGVDAFAQKLAARVPLSYGAWTEVVEAAHAHV